MAALPRPSSTLVPSFAATRDYYAARDTVDLERAELVRIISWTRKMAIKLTGMALLLGLLVCLSPVRACSAATQWTPDDFDWAAMPARPPPPRPVRPRLLCQPQLLGRHAG